MLELEVQIEGGLTLDMTSGAVQVYPSGTAYPGPYSVTPTLAGFDVATENLFMTDDLTVEPIPIQQASNPQGGYTYTIG